MLYDTYVDSESYAFVHPRTLVIRSIGGSYMRAVTPAGFFVATKFKVRGGRLAVNVPNC